MLWNKEDGVEEDQVGVGVGWGTHCEAPHWCVHPQVTERVERPTRERERERLEMQKGERPKGLEVLQQRSVNGSSHKSSKER